MANEAGGGGMTVVRRTLPGASRRQAADAFVVAERNRALWAFLAELGAPPLPSLRALDVGCGAGGFLAALIERGAEPANLAGIELRPDLARLTSERAPGARVDVGDGRELPYAQASFDLVTMFTVLSSTRDADARAALVREAMRVLRPGGWLVIYDFWWNPLNRDARPVRLSELRRMLPGSKMRARRVTLAPPLVRALVLRAPGLCRSLERVPLLRSHYLVAMRRG